VLALALSACAIDSETFQIPELKRSEFTFVRPDWNVQARNDFAHRPLTPDDLIGPDGRCPGEQFDQQPSQALNFTAGPETPRPDRGGPPGPVAPPQVQQTTRGVGLGMTECEVVRMIGHTDRIEMAADERGQRAVVLTYIQGPRPGIYRFAAGRLITIERGPEPPPAPKPEKKKTAKKPPPKKPGDS
jgi:hypothetical protein